MNQVICFGEILWDNFPTGKKPGGAPMNVALHLHKKLINSILISSVGTDEYGNDLKKYLLQNGLSTGFIQQNQTLPTGIVDITLDESKQATYTIVKPVAWDEIQFNEDLIELVRNSAAIVFGSLACRSNLNYQTLLNLLKVSSLPIFDMNLRPPHFEVNILEKLLEKCTILKINKDELEYLENHYSLKKGGIESGLKQLSVLTNTPTICVTLGDKGAIVLFEDRIYKHPGFPINVADTVGAGDAFLATFISGYLQKFPMQQILTRACATGALVASKQGANPDYSQNEIDKLCNF